MNNTIIFSIISFIVGFLLRHLLLGFTRTDGIIEIDTSDTEKDKYLFLFTIPLADIRKKRFILFETKKVKSLK